MLTRMFTARRLTQTQAHSDRKRRLTNSGLSVTEVDAETEMRRLTDSPLSVTSVESSFTDTNTHR